ncbi:uncharacterized protein N7503_007804 [Penicillium pulvis]|uniref:uncharacterized protein n=1 Tax=Penicillium pulvis TaxID=1562058 RepID=UPI002547D673|nr:uncharacterized protein N7503_007804 [Penicillium pulvis]KAJ5798508.1 hypothetical protein N7503_007804 [Penicillium pulvis]
MSTQQEREKVSAELALSARFSFFSSKTQQAITSSTWEGLFPSGNPDDIIQEKLKAHPEPSRPVWWFDICDATMEDVDLVSQELSIHPLTSEDIKLRESREKVDVFRNYYLISFKTLVERAIPDENDRPGIPSSASVYILVFQYGVVTFSPSGCTHISQVRDRIRKMHDTELSSDWICYALIDDIVDSFQPFGRAAAAESDAIEDQVFIARIDDVQELIPRIDALRKTITHIVRCLNGKVDVLNGFVKRCHAADKDLPVFPKGELILYLGDVQDHLVTTLSMLAHIDEIIGRSQGNCLAQLSATNLRISLTVNSVMSKVTIMATIFVPCHLVTGMFGMNVPVPGQDTKGLSWFFGIVGVFVAFMMISMAAAAKYKLL